jgi:ribosomal protein S18 acetylase RimI-like enzyme
MRTRILDYEAWDRLKLEAEANPLCEYATPENMDVVAVEDEAGKIIASLGVIRMTHLEGLWVAPKYRKNPGVMRALLRQAFTLAQTRGEKWVLGGAANDEMRGYGSRLGKRLPMDFYRMWLGNA